MHVHAAILAGGRSRRFGSDKARAVVEGSPLILRVVEAVRPVAGSILVVADEPDKYADLGLSTVADPIPDAGPMSGLAGALARLPAGFGLVLPCDLIGLRTPWLRTLRGAADDEVDAVVFESDRLEPLPGLYHTRLATEALVRARSGPRALVRLLADVRTRRLPAPGDWARIGRVTRPSDLPAD